MKCNRQIPTIKKKGVITTPARICDGDIKCVDAYIDIQKDYCICDSNDYCGHYTGELKIIYACTKCKNPTRPITDVDELVNVINYFLGSETSL